MKIRFAGVLGSLALLLGGAVSGARAEPVQVDLTALRAIQTFALGEKDDDAYLLVTGVAKGEELNSRVPKEGALPASPKKPPVTEKEPVTLWKGELEKGEFAQVTVTLMIGKGADAAKTKEFLDKLAAANKGVAERSKKSLASNDEAKALAAATTKAHAALIEKVKEIFSREKNTDHYGGQFSVLVWNDGEKIRKRVDPVGLTFGEHHGIGPKVYTKLKWTRKNVILQDEGNGEFYEDQLKPVSDEEVTVRVKMLENEALKQGGQELNTTTDYLAELQVKVDGKPLKWSTADEQVGPGELHTYWNYAE